MLHGHRVSVGVPIDAVVGKITCLPMNESLSNIVIDWGDGSTSAGTATSETEAGGASKTALIRGTHVYTRPTCPTAAPCPGSCAVAVSATTDSDRATRAGGGYEIQVSDPGAVAPLPAPIPEPVPGGGGRGARAQRSECGLEVSARNGRDGKPRVRLSARSRIRVELTATARNARRRVIRTTTCTVRLNDGSTSPRRSCREGRATCVSRPRLPATERCCPAAVRSPSRSRGRERCRRRGRTCFPAGAVRDLVGALRAETRARRRSRFRGETAYTRSPLPRVPARGSSLVPVRFAPARRRR